MKISKITAVPPVAHPPEKPLLVYDGNCGFCRKWIRRWRFLTGSHVLYEPYQKVSQTFPEIPQECFEKSVQLVEPDGLVTQGAHAVFRSLSSVAFLRWLLWSHDHLPGFAFISETLYAFVAQHRHLFSSVDACGLSPADQPPSYFHSRWLFLKVLGFCYLVAFGSFWIQADGLIGQNGILPVQFFLKAVKAQLGPEAWTQVPSLFWLDDSNHFLHLVCATGVTLSVLVILDLVPFLCLAPLWFLYLSLVSVGQDFFSFQWDNLLLEAGFLAIFMIPFTARLGRTTDHPPSRVIPFLFQWLLFRLMFSSGFVKLASGDPNWRHLTALEYHYQTQPLPTPLAWYMFQLPHGFQQVSCFFVFVIELLVPFFIFGPRKLRPWAFGLLVSLQILIALTGNYCFFNLLTMGLCLFVLEDEAYPRWWKRWWKKIPNAQASRAPSWPRWITLPLTAWILYLSLIQMVYTLGGRIELSGFWAAPFQWAEPFRSVNSYGLFAVMTTTRPEITVEGSKDGIHWLPYEFKWKPGNLNRAPAYVAPYQPRLDWQMWFAALGTYRDNPWFINFLVRLLQGSPSVLSLLKTNPFPDQPPVFIRAQLDQYDFTNFSQKAQTGQWWKKENLGLYIPAFSLKDLQTH